MIEMNASIFSIHKLSFVDGPGIRTAVFFKGCNLKCAWCHNPESQSISKQRLVYKSRCRHCGKCREVCPFHLEKCDFCGKCVVNCENKAIEICGEEMSADRMLSEILKDRIFFENSGGGVTFSGGESMLQIDFLCEILRMCREQGIHTAVDTAGNVPWNSFERVLPNTDLFLYDIKSMNSDTHKRYTGVGNELILSNLAKLLRLGAQIWIRVPVIPGVNDSEEEMHCMKAFFEENGYPKKVELLPYHKMGEHKYESMDRTVVRFEVPSQEQIKMLEQMIAFDEPAAAK